jgi:hypothetical protein
MKSLAVGQIIIHVFVLGSIRLFPPVARLFLSATPVKFGTMTRICTCLITILIPVHLWTMMFMLQVHNFCYPMYYVIVYQLIILVILVAIAAVRIFTINTDQFDKTFVANPNI